MFQKTSPQSLDSVFRCVKALFSFLSLFCVCAKKDEKLTWLINCLSPSLPNVWIILDDVQSQGNADLGHLRKPGMYVHGHTQVSRQLSGYER